MANSEQVNKNVSLGLIADYGASDSESDTETRSNTTGNESDATEFSEMVIKNNIINACAHGPLSRPKSDTEDVTRHMIIDNCESGVVEYEVTEYRDVDSSSDSSSSSDSDIDSIKDIDEVSSGDEIEGSSKATKPEPPKVNGELGLEDLPPIEDLAISLPSQECTKIGVIASIVDRLVVISAFPNTPAVDLESILFVESGAKALGKVFDVFGPVTEPHYCVRFNSVDHVRERGIHPGMEVFIAPQSHHTNYVFLAELMKMKGSDASWLNDIEPPPHQVDYSDDEEERKANRARKEQNRQKQSEENDNDDETPRNVRKVPERRNQRPNESSSRFGSGPSRGRNPFSAGPRRGNHCTPLPRFTRPWSGSMDLRTPPPHPNDPGGPFRAPPMITDNSFPTVYFQPTFPQMNHFFQSSRMRSPAPHGPVRHNMPVFGSGFSNSPGPQARWMNHGPPPPPGT